MRGSKVVVICPKRLLVMLVLGLANCAVLKMLKNSARNSATNLFSPMMDVVLASAKSAFVRLGPRKKFRGSVPYVRRAGLVAQAVHVASSPAREKLAGLNQ